MNVNGPNKRSIKYDEIRQGTIFKCDGRTYLKCQNNQAVDMASGDILTVDAHDKAWSLCYIYPKASLNYN